MPRCPLCGQEVTIRSDGDFICAECDEVIPKDFAVESKVPCCDPSHKCR
ncbi:MAG: hypothetical protein JSW28_08820 [Thermoplasmata archaeon]|nr:MAG: hypothetical protein JSW28_08820 [Thermoplasmata archaeon]